MIRLKGVTLLRYVHGGNSVRIANIITCKTIWLKNTVKNLFAIHALIFLFRSIYPGLAKAGNRQGLPIALAVLPSVLSFSFKFRLLDDDIGEHYKSNKW